MVLTDYSRRNSEQRKESVKGLAAVWKAAEEQFMGRSLTQIKTGDAAVG